MMKIQKWINWCKDHYGIVPESNGHKWEAVYDNQFFEAYTEVELMRNIAQNTNVITCYEYTEQQNKS